MENKGIKTLYKFRNSLYSYNQLRVIYSHSRITKKTTFDDWLNKNLLKGNIINYTEHKKCLTLDEVVDYAYYHGLGEMYFEHENGKKFTVLDAELGLINVEGENRTYTYEELENKYKNKKIFSVCQ